MQLRESQATVVLQRWLVGWLVFPTRFQLRIRSYARMPGVADSRRGADVTLHRPTSLSKEPSVPRGLALSGFYLRLCTSRL
jgi:hypothetical protein